MAGRKHKTRQWYQRHVGDAAVKDAVKKGYRSRSAIKLQQIQARFNLVKSGMSVLDVGAAPGGWSQCLVDWVGPKGFVCAVDLLPMATIAGVTFLQGDFLDGVVQEKLLALLSEGRLDVVVSDMAANRTGLAAVDDGHMEALMVQLISLCTATLAEDGALVVKVFQGGAFEQARAALKGVFAKLVSYKPKASRPESREVYLIATGFQSQSF